MLVADLVGKRALIWGELLDRKTGSLLIFLRVPYHRRA